MIYLSMGFLAGICVVISRIVNANLSKRIGIFESTFFNYVTGLSLSFVFLLFSGQGTSLLRFHEASIPWWAYLGGLVGVLVVSLSSYITPKISNFYLTLFIFAGQLFTSMLIDYFTLNLLSIGKIIGGVLVLAGLIYNLTVDRQLHPYVC